MSPPPLVQAADLVKHFPLRSGVFSRVSGAVHAVNGVSFSIGRGETLSLVGESGSGKTTVGRCVLRLYEPDEGEVRFDGVDVLNASRKQLTLLRRRMQIIFQDPFGSLNPRMTVYAMLVEILRFHSLAGHRELRAQVLQLLDRVGLPAGAADRYPHEFSGGQRQRIGIARALAVQPDFIVADEPVSALDVSIQAQILNLMRDLQAQMGLTYLFIGHNLDVVRHISDRIAVMYLGRIVETATRADLFDNPTHPYTRALLSAIPVADPARRKERTPPTGEPPSPIHPPGGCPFHPRCPHARESCAHNAQRLLSVAPGHEAACEVFAPETPAPAPR